MKKRIEFRESFKRFNSLQKIIALFFIITLILSVALFFFTNDFQLFFVVLGIAIGISLIVFNITKKNKPFVVTKVSLEQFNLMGEANFFTIKKTYITDSPLSTRFRYKNLLMIREYRQDGTLFKETPYKNGKIWGEVKTYSVTGKLRKSASYYEGEIEGKNIEMDGDEVAKEASYKGAHLHGVSKTYDKETGNLILEENYRYGTKHGPAIHYNAKNQQKTCEENYKDGRKYGKTVFFNKQGKPIRELDYRDDMVHGKVCEYYSDGQVKLEENFDRGKKEGAAKEFYENGAVKSEFRYRKGKKHGPQFSYYKSGDIMTKQFYEYGEKKGDAIFYDPDGNPVE